MPSWTPSEGKAAQLEWRIHPGRVELLQRFPDGYFHGLGMVSGSGDVWVGAKVGTGAQMDEYIECCRAGTLIKAMMRLEELVRREWGYEQEDYSLVLPELYARRGRP